MVAVRRVELIPKKGWMWLIRCDCGNERTIASGTFNAGGYKSCGCKRGEAIGDAKRTHGKSGTYAYWLRSLAKKRARDRGVPCDLSLSFVEKLIAETKVCPYLGIPIKSNKGKLSWNSATLDRVSPELGYVESNVMLISHRANTIKNDATPDEVMLVAIGLAKRLGRLPETFGEIASTQIAVTPQHNQGTVAGQS